LSATSERATTNSMLRMVSAQRWRPTAATATTILFTPDRVWPSSGAMRVWILSSAEPAAIIFTVDRAPTG